MGCVPEDALIAALKARLPHIDAHRHGPQPAPAAPLSANELAEVEATLGFPLPPVLKQVYQEVGNGGFGPGYGLMGIGSGGFPDDQNQTVDTLYAVFTTPIPGARSFGWPKRLLPICHYGCAVYDCVNVDTEEMVVWEPNLLGDDRKPVKTALFPIGTSLSEWFRRWSLGEAPADHSQINMYLREYLRYTIWNPKSRVQSRETRTS